MSLVALLIDIVAAGLYFIQKQAMAVSLFRIGLVVQVVLTVVLLIMVFSYKGQRKSRFFDFADWIHPWTLRYGIIVFSFLINAVLIFLYWLNVSGTNTLIFSR